MRHGYTGILLDDQDEDLEVKYESRALQNFAGIANAESKPTELSGEFYYSSSAVHCLQHLITLSTTGILRNNCLLNDHDCPRS